MIEGGFAASPGMDRIKKSRHFMNSGGFVKELSLNPN